MPVQRERKTHASHVGRCVRSDACHTYLFIESSSPLASEDLVTVFCPPW